MKTLHRHATDHHHWRQFVASAEKGGTSVRVVIQVLQFVPNVPLGEVVLDYPAGASALMRVERDGRGDIALRWLGHGVGAFWGRPSSPGPLSQRLGEEETLRSSDRLDARLRGRFLAVLGEGERRGHSGSDCWRG